MKTKELVYELDKMGFLVVETNSRVEVRKASRINEEGSLLAHVDKLNYALMDVSANLMLVEPYVRAEILKALYEYATTPMKERDDVKKFIYRFPYIVKGHDYGRPKHVIRGDNCLLLDGSNEYHVSVSGPFHFTDEQVEEYTGKDRQLFELCEKIEVNGEISE